MIRRKFLECSGKAALSLGLGLAFRPENSAGQSLAPAPASGAEQVLPGTHPLTQQGDLAGEMEDGIRRFLLRRTEEMKQARAQFWRPDDRAGTNSEKSVHRENLRRIIGVIDPRVLPSTPEILNAPGENSELAGGNNYKIFAVRWAVFDPAVAGAGGMSAEGLLLQPAESERARVIALPDADWTPEMLVGLAEGVPTGAQFARRLAENGCRVLIPLLINRDDTFSGVPELKMTNEPHREWIYRMAFEMGRHIIGYEVQKVLAAVDWFASDAKKLPIGVMGYGEGGLIALYSAALDTRIDAAAVSGYFQERENLWREPIYRDIFGLVREFGDAEIASLIAPRALIVEACRGPEIEGPPPAKTQAENVACPNGKLTTPPIDSVRREIVRALAMFKAQGHEQNLQLVVNEDGQGSPGSEDTLKAFLQALGLHATLQRVSEPPRQVRPGVDVQLRLRSQLGEMVAFTQGLVKKAPEQRAEFWSKADASSPERWKESTQPQRDSIWQEVMGKLDDPKLPPNARSRLVHDQPKFRGYEVMLDVWPEVVGYGTILVPKDLRAGERRPVVVCEHGLEGRTQEVADPKIDSQFYHHFGARLADLGFVVYAPQDPFVEGERFRMIQRMAHPLKLSIYSFILGQHQQLLKWLAELPFVDPARIGFYGLSYGGKTAMRVPTLLEEYALCICSGDFNQGTAKMTGVDSKDSVMVDDSYDLYEFNFANVVDYAELAKLMAPRPFMVERGHSDATSTDELVAAEYAKVKSFYERLGIGDRTAIEYFDGGHTIHGEGTFEFLRKQLRL